jgi:hypothetical protein
MNKKKSIQDDGYNTVRCGRNTMPTKRTRNVLKRPFTIVLVWPGYNQICFEFLIDFVLISWLPIHPWCLFNLEIKRLLNLNKKNLLILIITSTEKQQISRLPKTSTADVSNFQGTSTGYRNFIRFHMISIKLKTRWAFKKLLKSDEICSICKNARYYIKVEKKFWKSMVGLLIVCE